VSPLKNLTYNFTCIDATVMFTGVEDAQVEELFSLDDSLFDDLK